MNDLFRWNETNSGFIQVQVVNECFSRAIHWQRYQISSFSLLWPASHCLPKACSQNNCVKNRAFASNLPHPSQYLSLSPKPNVNLRKMLLSNRKIKEANDDNKKTMAVKMVFNEWLLQSISLSLSLCKWVSGAHNYWTFPMIKYKRELLYVYIHYGDNEVFERNCTKPCNTN